LKLYAEMFITYHYFMIQTRWRVDVSCTIARIVAC
jgi:hypothetical protein